MNTPARMRIPADLLSVGIEEGPDGAALIHSLGVPGCVAYGESPEEALDRFTGRLGEWLDFREAAGLPVPSRDEELQIAVDEWIRSDADISGGESEVCFESDLRPLSDREITESLQLLGDLRGLLLRSLRGVPRDRLDEIRTGSLTLARLADELARAQWWTLSRLGASPMADVPGQPIGRLDTAMALVVQQFTNLDEEARSRVIEMEGESWTPRKVLRRLLWLEWSLGSAARLALLAEGVE